MHYRLHYLGPNKVSYNVQLSARCIVLTEVCGPGAVCLPSLSRRLAVYGEQNHTEAEFSHSMANLSRADPEMGSSKTQNK